MVHISGGTKVYTLIHLSPSPPGTTPPGRTLSVAHAPREACTLSFQASGASETAPPGRESVSSGISILALLLG